MDWPTSPTAAPFPAAETRHPPGPGVRAIANRSRHCTTAGFFFLLFGLFLGATALKSNGFVVSELLPYAGVLIAVGAGLLVLSRRQAAAVQAATGLARKDCVNAVLTPRSLQPVPDGLAPVFGVFGLIGSATMVIFTLPVIVAAASLGQPTTTTAVSSSVSDSCGRCHQSATATFQVGGQTVTAPLAAPGINEEAPTSVVYDAGHPSHAMSAADYAFGRSQVPLRRLAGTLLVGAASFSWGLMLARRNGSCSAPAGPASPSPTWSCRLPTEGPRAGTSRSQTGSTPTTSTPRTSGSCSCSGSRLIPAGSSHRRPRLWSCSAPPELGAA